MSPNPKEKPINWIAVRIALIALVFAMGTVILSVRAYRLQISDAETLKKRADKQRTKVIHLEARRGAIFDRSGEQIAVSLEVNSIYARPKRIQDKKETAHILGQILEMDADEIAKKLSDDKTFVWIQRRVSPLLAEQVRKSDLQGIMIGSEYHRFYPLKSLASHVIGFAGMDSNGLEGIELAYDQELKVDSIPVTAQTDALGRPVMFTAMGRDAKRRDIHLTLDRNIQHIVEKELEEAVNKYRAKSGVVVVLDADTGEIPALAVRPTYNLNTFAKTEPEARRNRAVADTFEPGSTFKVFLAATALDLDKVSPEETFNCNRGVYRYNGSEIHDVVPHKSLSFEDIIVYSSNIGAVKISEKLTKSEFYRVLYSFGFGAPSGIDMPGERPGVLQLPGKWSILSKANIGFGQGVSVNAVQLCTAFAAAINGGVLYKPHFVKSVTNALGETVREFPPTQVRRVIKPETSAKLVEILREAVTRGTGKAAQIPGVEVIGKTGTAQKADSQGGYSHEKYVASFLGAIMGTKPRLVMFVMLDEPSGKMRQGGKLAAPVFKKIGEAIIASCGRQPTESEGIIASQNCAVKKQIAGRKNTAAPKKGPKSGEWIIPDLKGLDMRQVVEICSQMKCDICVQGFGLVVDQQPKAGAVLKEGAPMTISFSGQS